MRLSTFAISREAAEEQQEGQLIDPRSVTVGFQENDPTLHPFSLKDWLSLQPGFQQGSWWSCSMIGNAVLVDKDNDKDGACFCDPTSPSVWFQGPIAAQLERLQNAITSVEVQGQIPDGTVWPAPDARPGTTLIVMPWFLNSNHWMMTEMRIDHTERTIDVVARDTLNDSQHRKLANRFLPVVAQLIASIPQLG